MCVVHSVAVILGETKDEQVQLMLILFYTFSFISDWGYVQELSVLLNKVKIEGVESWWEWSLESFGFVKASQRAFLGMNER